MNQEKKSKCARCITINTDASFHPTQKVGGYAFHIVCDHFRIKKGGKFKANPENSEEAGPVGLRLTVGCMRRFACRNFQINHNC